MIYLGGNFVQMPGKPTGVRFPSPAKSAQCRSPSPVRAVPKLEAEKFWALRPQRPGKIIPMLATCLISLIGRASRSQ